MVWGVAARDKYALRAECRQAHPFASYAQQELPFQASCQMRQTLKSLIDDVPHKQAALVTLCGAREQAVLEVVWMHPYLQTSRPCLGRTSSLGCAAAALQAGPSLPWPSFGWPSDCRSESRSGDHGVSSKRGPGAAPRRAAASTPAADMLSLEATCCWMLATRWPGCQGPLS